MSAVSKTLEKASRVTAMLGRARRSVRRAKAHRADFYVELWNRAAAEIGASVTETCGDLFTVTRGDAMARVMRNYTDLDGPVTLRLAGNKPQVHKLLRSQGLPTPEHLQFSLDDLSAALGFLRRHAVCVVKPAADTGAGSGVTTNVTTRAQLYQAAIRAAGHSSELLIEQQIAGENVRLLFLDGRLLDAVQRCAPAVVGDGRSTIGALVRQANRHRLDGGHAVAQTVLKHDLDMKRTLAAQGLSWRAIPANGQSVRLNTVVNSNSALENVSVMDTISATIVEAGRRAVDAIGARLAGVDVISPDLTTDLESAGGVVLEVNTTPGLYIHEGSCNGSVATAILEACLQSSRRNSERQEEASVAIASGYSRDDSHSAGISDWA